MSAKITVKETTVPENYDVLMKIFKNASAITREINERLAKTAYKRIKEICFKAVEAYYNAYTPFIYKRKESLYSAYDIGIRNGDELTVEVGPDLMNAWHRVDAEYIYTMMFEQGWHGGAWKGSGHPAPGTPYWRMPSTPRVMYLDEEDELVYATPWSFWYPHPAAKSTAPYDMIVDAWDIYLDGEYEDIKMNILREIIGGYFRD